MVVAGRAEMAKAKAKAKAIFFYRSGELEI